jgi:16S rRNA processing protein RimM
MGAQKRVALGYVSAVHGVKGWVKIHSWTRPIEAIFDYQPWRLESGKEPVGISEGRRQGKGLVALFPGIDDRDQAANLVGQ